MDFEQGFEEMSARRNEALEQRDNYGRLLDTALSLETKEKLKQTGLRQEDPAFLEALRAIVEEREIALQTAAVAIRNRLDTSATNDEDSSSRDALDKERDALDKEREEMKKNQEAILEAMDKEREATKRQSEATEKKLREAMKKQREASDVRDKNNLEKNERLQKELEIAKAGKPRIKLTAEQVKAAKKKCAKKVIEETIEVAKTQGPLTEIIEQIQTDGTDYLEEVKDTSGIRICNNLANGDTGLQFVAMYKIGTYLENELTAGLIRDSKFTYTKLLAELKVKGIVISGANCTYYRQLKTAMDATKAYKFLYCCKINWSGTKGGTYGLREMFVDKIFLDALKSSETKSRDDFANLKV